MISGADVPDPADIRRQSLIAPAFATHVFSIPAGSSLKAASVIATFIPSFLAIRRLLEAGLWGASLPKVRGAVTSRRRRLLRVVPAHTNDL